MDTNAESSMQNKVIEYVKQYAMITLSISIMSVGVYFFKFPNNFVFGGVTGMAALAAKLTPLSASAFSSAANMILLGVGLIFLGKVCHDHRLCHCGHVAGADGAGKICPLRGPLSDQPMLDLLFAIALPAIASALLFNVGASSGGTDVIALIVEKYTHIHNVAVALFLTDLFMVIAACFVFDLYTALYSFVGLTVKSLVIDAVLERSRCARPSSSSATTGSRSVILSCASWCAAQPIRPASARIPISPTTSSTPP